MAIELADGAVRPSRIPIILSVVQDRERGLRVGVDRYLIQLIDSEGLLGEVIPCSAGARRKRC